MVMRRTVLFDVMVSVPPLTILTYPVWGVLVPSKDTVTSPTVIVLLDHLVAMLKVAAKACDVNDTTANMRKNNLFKLTEF